VLLVVLVVRCPARGLVCVSRMGIICRSSVGVRRGWMRLVVSFDYSSSCEVMRGQVSI
jgi:hypothetical protein